MSNPIYITEIFIFIRYAIMGLYWLTDDHFIYGQISSLV